MTTETPSYSPERQERIDRWARQAFLCYRDGRPDLVDICLEELSALNYGGERINWEDPA